MDTHPERLAVAVAQAAPVFMDREATVDKACDLIAAAGRRGARIVAFTESFIPGYPDWVWAVPAGEESLLSCLYAAFLENSVDVPGPAVTRLGEAARDASAYVVIGVSERNREASGGSLYNTLLYFAPDGSLLGKHRKLVPTGGERLVWGQGDGSTLEVHETPYGRLGGLICWENYMPLARYALYAWGVQIYVAATWDRGDPWQATLRHIAREGRMLVLGAGMTLRKGDVPVELGLARYYEHVEDWINTGGSAIVSPSGDLLAGPLECEEGLLFAEVDLPAAQGSRWMFDAAGHYSRPDVFELTVRRDSRPVARLV